MSDVVDISRDLKLVQLQYSHKTFTFPKLSKTTRIFIVGLISQLFIYSSFVLVNMVISIEIYKATGIALTVASILLLNRLPNFLFSYFMGKIIDSFSKKKIVLISEIVLSFLTIAIGYSLETKNLYLIFTLMVIRAILTSFDNLSRLSIVPFLDLDSPTLKRFNSAIATINQVSTIIAGTFGYFFYKYLSIFYIFPVCSTLYFILAFGYLLIITKSPIDSAEEKKYINFKSVFKIISENKMLKFSVLGHTVFIMFLGSFLFLTITYPVKYLEISSSMVPLYFIFYGMAALFILLFILNINQDFLSNVRFVKIGLILIILPSISFFITKNFTLSLIAYGFIFFVYLPCYAILENIILMNTDKRMLGSVKGVVASAFEGTYIISTLIFSFLYDKVSTNFFLALFFGTYILIAAYFLWRQKNV